MSATTVTVAKSPRRARRPAFPQDQGSGARITQAGEQRSARVESLRALAAVSVLASHAFVYSYGIATHYWQRVLLECGDGGVYLFFVLSGYLLFWPFARSAFVTHEPVSVRRYALNRAVRILPLYYALLAILLLVQHHGGSWDQWWRFGLFAQDFSSKTIFTVDAPIWTLAVEVQFYLVLPVLAKLVLGLARGSRGRAALVLLVIGGASFAARDITVYHLVPQRFVWSTSLPTMLMYFVLGMLLALLRIGWMERPPRWLGTVAGRSDLWVLCAIALWLIACAHYTYESAAGLAAALVIGACVLPLRGGVFVALTETRVLSRLGLASYSLYLWHVPVMIVLAGGSLTGGGAVEAIPTPAHLIKLFGLGLLVSVPVAALSYRVIEAPPLRLRRRWAQSTPPNPDVAQPEAAPEPMPAASSA